MTLCELCEKSVVNLSTGGNLGRVDDLEFSPENASVTHLIIYGKPRLFGLLGRGEDMRVEWSRIRTIGTDVVLIESDAQCKEEKASPAKIWKF